MRVVPALDEIEDRHARLGLGLEGSPVEQLAFEGGEEALAHRVVKTVAHRTHRRPHPGLLAALAEGKRGILSGPGRNGESRQWVAVARAPCRAP